MKTEKDDRYCGIIMPIASMGEYSSAHWLEVKSLITEAVKSIEGYNFEIDLVSESLSGEVETIHSRIISNIYNADIVVCDISGRNPNVFFELGMRLTFDKPTVIIKDDVTPNPFDISSIEYISYPKGMMYRDILSFKKKLAEKVKATMLKKESSGESFSQFIKAFGDFTVPKLDQKEIPQSEYILNELRLMRKEISKDKKSNGSSNEAKKKSNQILNKFNEFESLRGLYDTHKYILKENPDFKDFSVEELFHNELYADLLLKHGPLNQFTLETLRNMIKYFGTEN